MGDVPMVGNSGPQRRGMPTDPSRRSGHGSCAWSNSTPPTRLPPRWQAITPKLWNPSPPEPPWSNTVTYSRLDQAPTTMAARHTTPTRPDRDRGLRRHSGDPSPLARQFRELQSNQLTQWPVPSPKPVPGSVTATLRRPGSVPLPVHLLGRDRPQRPCLAPTRPEAL